MRLSAPAFGTFMISLLLVVGVVALKYFAVTIPVVGPIVGQSMFEVLLVAYVILAAGAVFRGM